MPAPLHSHSYSSLFAPNQQAPSSGHNGPQVHVYHRDKDAIAYIHRTLTVQEYSEPHSLFDKFLDEEVRGGKKRSNLSIYFQSVSTWGEGDGTHSCENIRNSSLAKKFAFVRPSAVCLARVMQDMLVTLALTFVYLIV